MNVTVSVFGRFHAFDLAAQLDRHGALERLITTYPRSVARSFGVPAGRIVSLWPQEVRYRMWNRLPGRVSQAIDARFWFQESFDRAAARRVPVDTDIYVGWSGFSEWGMERARSVGAVTVLERGSAHIEAQRDLLQAEFERQGVTGEVPHPLTVAKEVREYAVADYISVPSSFARQTFIERGVPSDKIIQIPYGVSVEAFPPTERIDEPFRVIYAGNMSLQKGVHYLIQAFAELRLPGAELWLVGHINPDIRDTFARYEGVYRHFDPVPQGQLHVLYGQASLFALCSIQDGFGMVLTQAMASGLPVIATSHTGGPDVVREGREGFIVPPGDVKAIKEKISYLYHHPAQRAAMGREAALTARRAYTWSDYGDRMVAAYGEMLRRKRRSQ